MFRAVHNMFVRTGTPLPRYDSTPSVQGNDDEDVDMITGHAEAQEEEALVIQTQMREDAVVLTAVAAEEVKAEQDPEADNLESVQMERYASFLEGFVPEKFGGHLETTLHFKNGAFFEERDEVQTLWRGNADVFKYIPGNMAFSTNKLLLLALWPDLVNFSDDVVLCLLQFLNDLQHFDGEEKGQFVDAVTKNSTVNIDLVATQAFHCGALTKAGLSALHGCLRADSFNDVQVLQSKSFDQWAYALHNLQKDRNTETLQVFVGKLRKILIPEADWKRDGLPRLLLHRFWDVENERRQGDRFASMITQAQELDSLYASMVHGASVKIPLTPDIWCPSHNIASTLFGMRESEQFFKDMWNSLGVVAVDWHEKQMISSGRRGPSGSLSIKDAVHLMRMTWEQSKLFRVSDAVMMTEKQIIARLQGEGHLDRFPHLQDPLLLCFIFRRNIKLRVQFASAVGKRLWTERVAATSRAIILEHQRSFGWSELEYGHLRNLMVDHGGADEVRREVARVVRENMVVTSLDYANILCMDHLHQKQTGIGNGGTVPPLELGGTVRGYHT